MMRNMMAVALATALLGASGASAATTKFDFAWTSTSGSSTSDPTMSASGKLEIAAMAGQSFTINDLISIDIEVSGNSIPTFKIDGTEPMQILSGRISSNGLFANFSDFFFGRSGGLSFGCDFRLCEQGTRPGENYNIVSGLAFTSTTSYPVSGRALGGLNAQLAVTQDPLDPNPIDPDPIDPDPVNPTPPSVVPLPSSAPLLLAGLAGLAFWRRRSRTA